MSPLVNLLATLGIVIAVLVAVELLALPDWLGRKLRGPSTSRAVTARIDALEARVADLERRHP
jgi:hypothetical protein